MCGIFTGSGKRRTTSGTDTRISNGCLVRIPGVGTSSSRGAAFPCDGASLCSLDVPADRRGLRSPGCAPVSAPRSRPYLRPGSSFANLLTPDGRSALRPPESLAESLRRTPDRLDPQGRPGPFPDLPREASQANPKFIFHLLPRIEDSFRTRQAMSRKVKKLDLLEFNDVAG